MEENICEPQDCSNLFCENVVIIKILCQSSQPEITCPKLTKETLETRTRCETCSKLTIKTPQRR